MELRPTIVYDTFWKFAANRQKAFYNKMNNVEPITSDPIIRDYRFTNVFRATDRTSQYLIKNVIYRGDQTANEVVFRTLLFKTFNKIETWEKIKCHMGEISYETFDFDLYDDEIFSKIDGLIFNGAYIAPTGLPNFGYNIKYKNHLKLIEYLMNNCITTKLQQCRNLGEVFLLFKNQPMFGNFLAYQFTIDINYSTVINFSEMDFVVAGLGAVRGIKKCFSNTEDYNFSDIIRWVCKKQDFEFEKRRLKFRDLFGRSLQLIDIQNIFCEVDKYSRMAHPEIGKHKRIKQKYKSNDTPIDYWFPPKWGLKWGTKI